MGVFISNIYSSLLVSSYLSHTVACFITFPQVYHSLVIQLASGGNANKERSQGGERVKEVSMRDTTTTTDSMQDAAASTDHSLSKNPKGSASMQLDTSTFNSLERDIQDMLCEIAEDKR